MTRNTISVHHSTVRKEALLALAVLSACDGGGGGFTIVPARGFFEPEAVDFGEAAIGGVAEAQVTLTNSSAGEILFTEVTFDRDGSAFAARAGGETLRGTRLRRGASVDITLLFGPSQERLYQSKMTVLSEELAIELELEGRGILIPPATPELVPSVMSFGNTIEIGRTVTKPLIVTNVGEMPGRLTRAESRAPFSVVAAGGGPAAPSMMLEPGASLDLEVTFTPEREGEARETLVFEMEGGATADLVVSGGGIQPANLTCDASVIDFGSAVRGNTLRQTVSCTADGPYTISDVAVAMGAPHFGVENVIPAPGSTSDTWSFDALFHASGIAGDRTGRVEIRAAHGPITSIDVTGTTEAPPAAETDLRIAVTWSAPGTDFDLHVVRMGEQPFSADDCHFAAKTLDWGTLDEEIDDPFLDRDDIRGPGTEELNLVEARDGFYDAYVMYFDDAAFVGPADVIVEHSLEGGAATTVTRAMGTCGNMWHVGTFDFRTSPATFTPAGTESSTWASRTEGCR